LPGLSSKGGGTKSVYVFKQVSVQKRRRIAYCKTLA
jgi:hypothetical protein